MAKCTHCGDCCRAELCHMGENVHKTKTPPCPSLIKKGDLYLCELIPMIEEEYKYIMYFKMGIGWGCTNDFKELING